jgi:hypothetical protein
MLFLPDEDLRVSDADRDAAVDFLTHHYASGRLSDAELSARIDAAHAARYDSQLQALTADLPALPAVRSGALERAARLRPALGVAGIAAAGVALATLLPPDAWLALVTLVLPLLMMLLFTVAPLAIPVLALLWLGRALTRPPGPRRLGRHSY